MNKNYIGKSEGWWKVVKSLAMPTPLNINYYWKGGRLLLIIWVRQVVSGIILSFNYVACSELAFFQVDIISREVVLGYLARVAHVRGASLFFILLLLHVGRGVYYGSSRMVWVWLRGLLILALSMAIAFLGYVLPWGQMRYWGATVITNFLRVLRNQLVIWVWGSFRVDSPTLTRFFSLHFLLPMLLGVLAGIHIFFLHLRGRSNPLGIISLGDKRPFKPYYLIKDFLGFGLILGVVLAFFLIVDPDEPQNYVEANRLVTPEHIQPEWYFLAAYAVLRAVPNKLGGVVVLVIFVFRLSLFVFTTTPPSSNRWMQLVYWTWVSRFILLTILGACVVEEPYIFVSQTICLVYFICVGLLAFL